VDASGVFRRDRGQSFLAKGGVDRKNDVSISFFQQRAAQGIPMRTFINQITRQFAIGQRQGRIAVATGCQRTFSAAQHLVLRHDGRLHRGHRHSHLGFGQDALAAVILNAWQNALHFWDLAADAVGKPASSKSYRMPLSASYGMSKVGLVPVAVCRLPVAIAATGMPMPRSADC
jgi:hypothetical protein